MAVSEPTIDARAQTKVAMTATPDTTDRRSPGMMPATPSEEAAIRVSNRGKPDSRGLIWPIIGLLAMPWLAAWFAFPGHLPPEWGEFPPEFPARTSVFSLPVFIVIAAAGLVILVLVLKPRWFGFQATHAEPGPAKAPLPWWFWLGAALTSCFTFLMATRAPALRALEVYGFSPLWYGFILVLDGWVYRRTGGRSLLASRPWTVLISLVVSLVGWLYFEYLNYFAGGYWSYPNADMEELSHVTVVVVFLIAYTTVWPALLEWYTLLATFPKFVARYARGPKLALPGGLLVILGFVLLFGLPFCPEPLFWALWVGPMAVIVGQMIRLQLWTPFTAMEQGNWSPAVLSGLAALFNGFFWEFWNHLSQHHREAPINPNFWVYHIPYVDELHFFSEMPLLGYLGYLPFGIMVWAMFSWAGALFHFDAQLDLEQRND